ncbi:nucleotide exchange factor GrpE [Pseudogracilibacillus sp. SE30717A]|uniref:nucleotide exchange factor GrpE n=1 Tax=Pseudogracilibacillus sp. SE30717A TaxID=3098293 RepID=UPI00300E2247
MEEQGKETTITEEETKTETNESEIETADSSSVEFESNESEEPTNLEELEQEGSNNEKLEGEINKLNEEIEQLKDRLLRNQAEFDNYKRRTQKEKTAERKYKSEELATELLPILDNFERALQTEISDENKSFMEGMKMVYNQFQTVLEAQGIKPIEAVNQEFDPTVHHAVMQVEEEDLESNTVVEELQKGYMLKDKVIRPAMVKVNK